MIKKIILGLIAGIICGLFGTGGGMILVPAFIYMLKIEPKKARATSLFCMLIMVIVSSIFYYKKHKIIKKYNKNFQVYRKFIYFLLLF